ncbi:MAG: hypothetical protein P4L83_12765, partial [Nevskia sp.]|nr:hypothetical protein [Nevskia sp.]
WINGGSVTIQTDMVSNEVSDVTNTGGSHTLTAEDKTQSIILDSGSVIDLSSGGYVTTKGVLQTASDGLPKGDGGSLSLTTYAASGKVTAFQSQTSTDGSYQQNAVAPDSLTASVTLDGTIYAAGLNEGGTFTLAVPAVTISGSAASVATDTTTGAVTLPTSFFTQGFSAYKLTSTYGDITVAAGTTLSLKQQTYQLSSTSTLPVTGALVRDFASLGYALDGLRQAVDLTLTQQAYGGFSYSTDPDHPAGITIGAGASIVADPGAAITLAAAGPVTVLGSIVAPGGSITISSDDSSLTHSANYAAAQDVWIGADAVLDVSGVYVPDPLVTAYTTGSVLDGGSITISSDGDIVALAGSTFDLQGASATIEEPSGGTSLRTAGIVTTPIWSDGGTLTLYGGGSSSSLYFAGTIDAAGGSSSASGGTFNIGTLITTTTTSSTSYALHSYTTLLIAQSGDVASALSSASAPTTASSLTALGLTSGTAFLTADTINGASLDSVSLTGGTIAFAGDVTLKVPDALYLNGNIALLPAGATGIAAAKASVASTVTLAAGYIRWLSGTEVVPTAGGGTLNLDASAQIDLAGVVSASYADSVNLTVSGGDIRFLPTSDTDVYGYMVTLNTYAGSDYSLTFTGGSVSSNEALLVPGDLTLTAREVYPATSTSFLLASLGLGGTITIASNGQTPYVPESADGALLVDAATIVQAGAIEVPLGSIILGLTAGQSFGAATTVATNSVTLAAGSLTSTSADGVTIPYGTTTDGTDWTVTIGDTNSSTSTILSAPPSKLVVLAGLSVTTAAGATVDESGGGDIYATEFVGGTGGTRNLLSTSNTYALVPSYEAKVAAYDTTSGTTVSLGSAVTLTGGNGIAAGTYVLLPASYATLPGAYRVVVVSTNTGRAATIDTVTADGSIYMTGTIANAITGAKSSATALFELQSDSVWTKYSKIDVTYGDAYFAALAAAAGTATPRLAEDAGQMIIAAASKLTLDATNDFTAASGGRGGEIDITGSNILVLASDQSESTADAAANTIVLSADQVSTLGVESVLLGGYRTTTTGGVLITATAENVEVKTDAADPLSGPELLLVTKAGGSGITVDAGSVIAAKGSVSAASSDALIIGATSASGDGALLRVSNGGVVTVTRNDLPASPTGTLTIKTGALLSGTSLTLDSSGTATGTGTTVADGATLSASNYDLAGGVINIGGGSSGLVLTDALIADFAGAETVTLRSASVFNFYGSVALGTAADPIGTLTLDGAGLYGAGTGTTNATVTASNIILKDSQSSANTGNGVSGSGDSLAFNATDVLTFGAGAKTSSGFSTIAASAGSEILFSGSGSLAAPQANVILTAPFLVADDGSSQSLTTTTTSGTGYQGAITILPGAGGTLSLSSSVIGGSLTLTAGSIADSGTIIAQSGTVTLEATTRDIVLSGNATISAAGTAILLSDELEDTPGGTVKLIADAGNITLGSGTAIDVSAAGSGYAGSLGIEATSGTVTLDGTLTGSGSSNALGGTFALSANALSGSLPISSGFTTEFEVGLSTGDITVPLGQTLTSATVLLQADGGWVIVNGTIDASGSSGGTIALYGTSGVDIEGSLKAMATTDGNSGGTVEIGTSGTAATETIGTTVYTLLNPTYGYEEVATSGQIKIGSSAVINVSGLDSSGNATDTGTVLIRAPLLEDGSVNVSVASGTITGAKAKDLEAYVVWSTADATTSGSTDVYDSSGKNVIEVVASQHFDGIVDPAGWYTSSGVLEPGTFANASGTTVAYWNGSELCTDSTCATLASNTLSYYLTNDYFTPSTYNTDHETFYAYSNSSTQTAGTLMGFVQNPLNGATATTTAATTASDAGLTLALGIELDNPSSTINSGNISVLTNWNLGAENSVGTLVYRTTATGQAPILTLRAKNDVNIDASITDGFTENTAVGTISTVTIPGDSYTGADGTYSSVTSTYTADLTAIKATTGIYAIDPTFSGVLDEPVVETSLNSNYTSSSLDYYYSLYDTYAGYYGTYLYRVYVYRNYFKSTGITLLTTTAANTTSAIYTYAQAALSYLSAATTAYKEISSSNSAYENLIYYSQYLAEYTQYASNYYNWAKTTQVYKTYGIAEAQVAPLSFSSNSAHVTASVAAGTTTVSTAAIDNSPSPTTKSSNYSPISSMDLASEASSASYRIVAGADFTSADPLAVDRGSGANVVIDDHISYTDPEITSATISIGNVVRTGTGFIDIAASGDFILADTTAPGAVYTAGTATTTPSDFTAPSVPSAYSSNPNGLVSTPTWATDGGAVTITVGGDIEGVESSSLDGATEWSTWYYHAFATNGTSTPFVSSSTVTTQQTAAWVNYATYADGIGALGGGNVTLRAGGTLKDIIVSLPETILVAGGTSATPTETEYTYGGGNLSVTAANIVGSAFLVGDGSGTIRVAGSITEDSSGNGLDLAVQNGFITVIANGSVTLGGLYDPAELANYTSRTGATAYTLDSALPGTTTLGNINSGYFTSYSDDSGVSLTSVSGDVTIVTAALGNKLLPSSLEGSSYSSILAPASLIIDAIGGDITLSGGFDSIANAPASGIDLVPSASGTLTLIAGGSIDLSSGVNYAITMLDGTSSYYVDPLGTPAPTVLSAALHADDDGSVLIYAGDDLYGTYSLIKQAEVYAGQDIINVVFTGQNNRATDVTSIIAGRDITTESEGTGTSTLALYGPGDFLVAAGRNLGPFNSGSGGGIFTYGDGSGTGDTTLVKSYLPVAGANLTALFGVGDGIDYTAAIDAYVLTSTDGISFLSSITSQLESTLDTLATQGKSNASAAGQLESLLAAWGLSSLAPTLTSGGLVPSGFSASIPVSSAQTLSIFQSDLSTAKQHLLVDHALVDFLKEVSTDYSNSASAYYKQYARAYQAIATLFPAAYGYTDNNTGGSNGASSTVQTGNLYMGFSRIETQTGGDITILG